MAGSEVACNS